MGHGALQSKGVEVMKTFVWELAAGDEVALARPFHCKKEDIRELSAYELSIGGKVVGGPFCVLRTDDGVLCFVPYDSIVEDGVLVDKSSLR